MELAFAMFGFAIGDPYKPKTMEVAIALPLVATVPAASGSVSVRLAVSVVGVSVTAYELVPPARPARITASCVLAACTRAEPNSCSLLVASSVVVPSKKLPVVANRPASVLLKMNVIGFIVPVPVKPDTSRTWVEPATNAPIDELLGSDELKTSICAFCALPFGITPTSVCVLVVDVWNIKRFENVALLKSPMMRRPVPLKVKLPVRVPPAKAKYVDAADAVVRYELMPA